MAHFCCDISIPVATAAGYFTAPVKELKLTFTPANIIFLNTFGCIVVVAKEAVVDFPGVTLFLH